MRTSAVARNAVLSVAKRDLVLAIVDCAKLIIKRKVPLTAAQLRKLRAIGNDIKTFVSRNTSHDVRRQTLQTGGFLGALIGPVLSMLPNIIGSLLTR